MKKILTAALCLTVPGLLFLNAWQGYRYNALSDQVAALEKEQKVLLEANRDIIGQIAFESSPERVAEKAAGLGLVPATRRRTAGQPGAQGSVRSGGRGRRPQPEGPLGDGHRRSQGNRFVLRPRCGKPRRGGRPAAGDVGNRLGCRGFARGHAGSALRGPAR